MQEEIENSRVKITKEEITDLINDIEILEISEWCDCRIGNIHIPRRMTLKSNRSKTLHIQNTIQANFTWDFMDTRTNNNYGLLNEIQKIRTGFINARRSENTIRIIQKKQNVIMYSAIGVGSMIMGLTILLITLSIIWKCKKSNKNNRTRLEIKKDILLLSIE